MPRVENTAELKPCPFCGAEANIVEMDGLEGWSWWKVVCSCCLIGTEEYPLKSAAIKVWNRRYEPPNDPLTLDELRQMGGEPVWIESPDMPERHGWAINYGLGPDVMHIQYAEIGLDMYGKTWHAYRRRPKEVSS